MVGVPGRSKGCNTCRKRKIGCDQRRPECGNCIKSNRICTGYHRTVVFHNATGPGRGTHVTKASVSLDPRRGPSDGDSSSPSSSVVGTTQDVITTRSYKGGTILREMGFPFITPSAQPHHRSALLANFLDCYTPSNSQMVGIPSAWVHSIPFVLNGGIQVLDTAVMAMCTAFVGRRCKDQQLLQESARIYTSALAELNAALSNCEIHTRDETLAATMSLGMYETMGCIDPTGWQQHANGTGLIVRLRGPEAHQGGLGHYLFCSFRSISLIHSLTTRKHSFLASKEWCTVPWAHMRKLPIQHLQDLITELPGIFEDRDTLPRSSYPQLLARCLDLKSRLKSWHENFTRTHAGPHYWPEFSTLNIDPPIFPTCYQFPNVGIANTYTFYWTNLILLYSTIIGLTPPPEQPIVTMEDICDLAAEICMAMEYYIAPDKKLYGPVLTIFPLRIAAECFKRMGGGGEKSALWCKALCAILEDKGVLLAKMLERLVWGNKDIGGVWGEKGWAGRGFWERMEGAGAVEECAATEA
ncbi:hypothetical protein L873DRAFT_1906139 [Choiromyces venosus 120613-1]|uniref:Zn(2)-C6 fungal-type domain-containing protein n=1 Tax=Choiromyces venosus 120613-1 TaxID=1336337 RepID=A0A3N4JMG1_9PEZI|nr:hypothetical protein L873DRAFT_1906139 [Choiromyces venosus 120613-1]